MIYTRYGEMTSYLVNISDLVNSAHLHGVEVYFSIGGTGEVKNTAGREHTDSYTAILSGNSIPGVRASNINRVADVLSRHTMVDPSNIVAVGIDDLCIPLIHAASLSNIITSLVLSGSPASYRSVALNRDYRIGFIVREGGGYWHPYEVDFTWGVGGALTAYDIPDLLATIAPRKAVISGMKNQMMKPADQQLVEWALSGNR